MIVVVGGTPAGMTRVISAASCYEQARKQKDEKTMLDASGCGARASDAGLIFADESLIKGRS